MLEGMVASWSLTIAQILPTTDFLCRSDTRFCHSYKDLWVPVLLVGQTRGKKLAICMLRVKKTAVRFLNCHKYVFLVFTTSLLLLEMKAMLTTSRRSTRNWPKLLVRYVRQCFVLHQMIEEGREFW